MENVLAAEEAQPGHNINKTNLDEELFIILKRQPIAISLAGALHSVINELNDIALSNLSEESKVHGHMFVAKYLKETADEAIRKAKEFSVFDKVLKEAEHARQQQAQTMQPDAVPADSQSESVT